jgi:hypothetical protein
MNSLPSSVNYAEVLPSLPENSTRYSVALQPVNGATFAPSSQIIFQFANRGYLIPDSVYLRYRMTLTAGTTAAISTSILATPFFTPFQRLETQFGSVTVDSINNYNQVCNMLTNCTMDWAQKYGNAFNYGYNIAGTSATTEEMDSRSVALAINATTDISLAGPLPCLLTNITDKLVPLFAMPTISMVLTLDALTNIMFNVTGFDATKGFVLSNVELCYDFIELGSEVDAMVRGMGDKIYIKSQSFSNSSVTIPAGANGSQSYIFNQRYASVKAAILILSSNANNKAFDAIDTTSGTGQISLNISGVQYPQKPYSTLNNKAAVLLELKKVMGSLYDRSNNMAINNAEYSYIDSSTPGVTAPGKFYIGFNLQKLNSNALLTGISTNNSNISVNIDQSTAVGVNNRQCNLILAYDALIEIDMVNKQSSVKV